MRDLLELVLKLFVKVRLAVERHGRPAMAVKDRDKVKALIVAPRDRRGRDRVLERVRGTAEHLRERDGAARGRSVLDEVCGFGGRG